MLIPFPNILDTDREITIELDDQRSFTAVPTLDSNKVILTLEDPVSVAIVEFSIDDFRDLVAHLFTLT